MEEQREAIRHSNRPLALILLAAFIGILGFLALSGDGADRAEPPASTTPISTTTPSTSAPPTTTVLSTTTSADRGLQIPFWWVEELATGETNARVRAVSDEHTVLLTDTVRVSGPDVGSHLAPRVRRLDQAVPEVLWSANGREGAAWRRVDPVFADGVVIIPDRPDQPEFETSLLWGFDAEEGGPLWAVLFRNDVVVNNTTFATVLEFERETVVLIRLESGRLLRIDPRNGNTMWDVELNIDNEVAAGDAQVILARSGDQLLGINPASGEVVGTAVAPPLPDPLSLGEGASTGQQWELADGTNLTSWSFPEGSGRAPGVARYAEDGTLLWDNEGRPGTQWQNVASFLVDGVAIWLDIEPGADSGAMVGFDVETGNRLWISQFRVPVASVPNVVSMQLRGGGAVLVAQTDSLGLIRVTPASGAPVWSSDVSVVRILGSIRRGNGSEAIAVVTESGNAFLDVDTGDAGPL